MHRMRRSLEEEGHGMSLESYICAMVLKMQEPHHVGAANALQIGTGQVDMHVQCPVGMSRKSFS